MMRGLAQSILTHTSSQFGPPPIEDRAHSLQFSGVGTPEEPKGSLTTTTTSRLQALPDPTPTDDRAHSLQSSGVGIPVEVKDRPTSTPTSRIQALLDPTVLVRLGFKVRPLRDGGGKPTTTSSSEASTSAGGTWEEDFGIGISMVYEGL